MNGRHDTVLLVASVGGHLAQLEELADRLEPAPQRRIWVTSPGPQADRLARRNEVITVAPITSRDWLGVLRGVPVAHRLLAEHRPDAVISTGAAIALSFLPVAAAHRCRAVYIESATRSIGPSLTGRLLQRCPAIELYTQHPACASARWHYVGSVFDSYRPVAVRGRAVPHVVVTVGTQERFGFRRLLDRLSAVVPDHWSVTWQTGGTDVSGLGIDARPWIPSDEMDHLMADADIVVSHAGTGSALTALRAGRVPILVPRDRGTGEHVDDHQELTATYLSSRGLAVVSHVDDLDLPTLRSAVSRGVERSAPPALALHLPERAR